MPRRVFEPSDDVTVYLVLIDHGKNGIAYDETDPAEADLETTIQNFLIGRPKSFCSERSMRVTISARVRSASSTDTSRGTRRRRNRARSNCSTVSRRI
jgi:hypothetical protein